MLKQPIKLAASTEHFTQRCKVNALKITEAELTLRIFREIQWEEQQQQVCKIQCGAAHKVKFYRNLILGYNQKTYYHFVSTTYHVEHEKPTKFQCTLRPANPNISEHKMSHRNRALKIEQNNKKESFHTIRGDELTIKDCIPHRVIKGSIPQYIRKGTSK